MQLELDPAYDAYDDRKQEVHVFATDILRPESIEIDRMPYEEYRHIAEEGSRYWDVMGEMKARGYHRGLVPEPLGGDGYDAQEFYTVLEELAWGSPGFAMALGAHCVPAIFAMSLPDDSRQAYLESWLREEGTAIQGSWAITEPTHGSATLQVSNLSDGGEIGDMPAANTAPPETTARREGAEWIIDGQKSDWVSTGPCATHTALQFDIDPGEPTVGRGALVDLDATGVTQGDPIEKLGQRACPQGPIAFEAVRVPDDHVVYDDPATLAPETGRLSMDQLLCITSVWMSIVSVGLARAAFEEALDRARQRKQTGRTIGHYQSVQRELYDMFELVESARTYARQVTEHVWHHAMEAQTFEASFPHALSAQVYCKSAAYEVAHGALQLHGGEGIKRDAIAEKLFRDARVKLIEDGTSEVLGMEAARSILQEYPN